MPTQTGYRVYTQGLVAEIEGRPGPFPLDLTAMRNELEEALSGRRRRCPTRPTCLRSSLRPRSSRSGAPCRGAAAPAAGRDRRRDHRVGERLEADLRARGRGRPRARRLGARVPRRDDRRQAREPDRRAPRVRGSGPLGPRERAFLGALRPVFADVVATATELYVGGAAGLLGDARGPGREGLPAPARGPRTARRRARAAPRRARSEADRCPRRPGARGRGARGPSYVGATYGLPNRSLGAVGLLGPLRMDYEKAIPLGAGRGLRALAARRGRYGAP